MQKKILMPVLDAFIETLRPLQLKGKGFIFDFVTPRKGRRIARVWGDYKMRLELANVIHRQIYMGCFGRYMTRCTRALLSTGGTFLDVGAHAGYFTLLAAHCVGRSGRLFAIEPISQTFETLRRHLDENGINNVRASEIALSKNTGHLRLYIPPEREHRDYNVTYAKRPCWTQVDVVSRTLDECLDEWKVESVELMKMDVEGAEPAVLEGGTRHLIEGTVKHLIVEVNGPRLSEGGGSPMSLVAQLEELGFLPARLSGRRAIVESAKNWDLHPDHEYDRLFVHRSTL